MPIYFDPYFFSPPAPPLGGSRPDPPSRVLKRSLSLTPPKALAVSGLAARGGRQRQRDDLLRPPAGHLCHFFSPLRAEYTQLFAKSQLLPLGKFFYIVKYIQPLPKPCAPGTLLGLKIGPLQCGSTQFPTDKQKYPTLSYLELAMS